MIRDRGDGFVDMDEESFAKLLTSGKSFACGKCGGLGFLKGPADKCTACACGRIGSLYVISKVEAIERVWEPDETVGSSGQT